MRHASWIAWDEATLTHLLLGSCLLAGEAEGCGCGLMAANGVFHEDAARRLWTLHRQEIEAAWQERRARGAKQYTERPWIAEFLSDADEA